MPNYLASFSPNTFYHVFNHSVDPELLFRNNENYRFFLQRVQKYIVPIADFYAYNLLGNHYHFLIRINPEEEIQKRFEELRLKPEQKLSPDNMPDFILKQFGNFQNSYAKAYNKRYSRMGRLFIESVKRVELTKETSLLNVIHYIHFNAVHHKLCRNLAEWPHSSYHSFLSSAPTLLMRKEVLEWFGGRDSFMKFHEQELPDALFKHQIWGQDADE
jgi:putative transposase